MTRDDAMELLAAALRQVAPDADLGELDQDEDMVEELDLDSMDVVSLLEELRTRSGAELSDTDVPSTLTVRAMVDRLAALT